MKNVLLALVVLFNVFNGFAQRENNVWVMGHYAGMDFSNGNPVPFRSSIHDADIHRKKVTQNSGASVCDKNGKLLFYTNGADIWNRTGKIMPYGKTVMPYRTAEYQPAAIIPVPGSATQYYVFSLGLYYEDTLALKGYNGRLHYSIIDMSYDNGYGDVIPGKKGILIDSLIFDKMTSVVGNDCNAWLMVRSAVANEFKAFEIDRMGVHPPVISAVGSMPAVGPIPGYKHYEGGDMFFSFDRKKLAMANACRVQAPYAPATSYVSAVELFDFDATTGIVSNPVIADIVGLPGTFGSTWAWFTSVCFSPDNSKLYAIFCNPVYSWLDSWMVQYDITMPPALIPLSRQAVDDSLFETQMKIGPDNKLYYSVSMGGVGGGGVKRLEFPNLSGTASQPTPGFIFMWDKINPQVHLNYHASVFPNHVPAMSELDTIYQTKRIVVCDKDSVVLQPDAPSINGKSKVVRVSGKYIMRYALNNCSDKVDTFDVVFQEPPVLSLDSIICPEAQDGRAWFTPIDSTRYTYTWKSAGDVLDENQSRIGDSINTLVPGTYIVDVKSADGCEASYQFTINAYPAANLVAKPAETIVKYNDSVRLRVDGCVICAWLPAATLSNSAISDPFAFPKERTVYTVIGYDEHSCIDSTTVSVDVDYTMLDFIPSAFTPNGDGRNDVFRSVGITYQQVVELKIFNRWGQLVYHESNGNKGWDGTQNSVPCDMGTYYYAVTVVYPNGASKTLTGDVTLVR